MHFFLLTMQYSHALGVDEFLYIGVFGFDGGPPLLLSLLLLLGGWSAPAAVTGPEFE